MRTLHVGSEPIVTPVVIGLCVLVFVVGFGQGGTAGDVSPEFLVRFGLSAHPIRAVLDGVAAEFHGVADGDWYRVLTYGFVHSGIIHLGLNMWLLWQLGGLLERRLGRTAMAAAFLASVVGGAVGGLLLEPNSIGVGASGGVFGLMGVEFLHQRARGIDVWRSGIGSLILLNLVLSFAIPNVSVGGHLGGLGAGLLCGLALEELPRRIRKPFVGPAVCVAIGILMFGLAMLAAERAVS